MSSISSSEFSRLFTEYRPRLVALANSYVHDTLVAEDIVADVFTKYWDRREIPQSQPQNSPQMYLYTMVRNRCLNYLRDRAARQRIVDARLKADLAILESEEPAWVSSGEIERELSRYLDGIPAARREIFCASRFDGLSHREIALKYGYTPRKIRREIGRVLEDIKRIVENNG
ncbi:MAG: sigma-70 family RNA polymerase sigma factor [Bacteroidales bacterium]|nr:sigma-70 family RNA polymerase sigma factor [Bacteroidales bacterium]